MRNMTQFMAGVLVLCLCAAAGAQETSAPQSADDARRADVQRVLDQLKRAQEEVASIREQVHQRRSAVQQATGRVEVTPDGVRRDMQRLQEQQQQLELDAAGASGRRSGLENAIAQLSKRLSSKAGADPVADELQKLVEVREKGLARVQELYKAASLSAAEVETAEASLAQARADLAAARQRAIGPVSTEALDAWNRELLNLSIDQMEHQAKLQFIRDRLERYRGVISSLDELESLQKQLTEAVRQRDDLSLSVAGLAPQLKQPQPAHETDSR